MTPALPFRSPGRWLTAWRRFVADRRGGLAVTFAIWVPVASVLLAGAIDLASVNATRTNLQDVVDAAAIDAGHQLGVSDPNALSQRTAANIAAQLGAHTNYTYTTDTVVQSNPAGVTVNIHANRTSFFVNLLPPGGWHINVTATAVPMGSLPLCVLSTGTLSNEQVSLAGTSRITAQGCLVHGNSDVRVGGSSMISAGLLQASGLASGPITPAPQSDAPPITDPFAQMNMSPFLPVCVPLQQILVGTVRTLLPGVHCGNLTVAQGSVLTLAPGNHYFVNGQLTLMQNAILQGDDVVLFFDSNSDFQFTDTSDIRLRGRRSGRYAGFVLATTRANTHTFNISSSSAHELLGTVYVPNATLQISGAAAVADQSAWTVIVAKRLQTNSAANLVVNSNYAGSSVPVPTGVGPAGGAVRLAH